MLLIKRNGRFGNLCTPLVEFNVLICINFEIIRSYMLLYKYKNHVFVSFFLFGINVCSLLETINLELVKWYHFALWAKSKLNWLVLIRGRGKRIKNINNEHWSAINGQHVINSHAKKKERFFHRKKTRFIHCKPYAYKSPANLHICFDLFV